MRGAVAPHPQRQVEHTERAILKTVLYSSLFDYPLTPDEIAHYLIQARSSKDQVRSSLAAPLWLDGQISCVAGYVTLRGREDLPARRREREKTSRGLWRKARPFGKILGLLPFVRMVAVTGALAVDNSAERDDVDVFIVTAPGRVWLTRALAIVAVYAARFTRTILCPNYIVSQEVLAVEPRTVYVAHEFVQMVPIYGFEIYRRMRDANPWIRDLLPNADRPLHEEPEYRPGRTVRAVKGALEWALSGKTGDWLEQWEMRRKIRRFARMHGSAGAGVVLDRTQVKGHFNDHGARISRQYQSRLVEYQLLPPGEV
jgi:hypothetical protein